MIQCVCDEGITTPVGQSLRSIRRNQSAHGYLIVVHQIHNTIALFIIPFLVLAADI